MAITISRSSAGLLLALLAVSIAALNASASKLVMQEAVSPLQLSALRALGASAVLLGGLVIVAPRRLLVPWRLVPGVVLYGAIGIAAAQVSTALAFQRLDVGLAILIQYLAPLLVALWTAAVVRRPLERRAWLGIGLAICGLAIVALASHGAAQVNALGVFFAAASAFAVATNYVLVERSVGQVQTPALIAWGTLIAGIVLGALNPSGVRDVLPVLDLRTGFRGLLVADGTPVWFLLMFIVGVGTVAYFATLLMAIRRLTATRTAVTQMLEPVLAAVAAHLLLAETLGSWQITGFAIVLAGVGWAGQPSPLIVGEIVDGEAA